MPLGTVIEHCNSIVDTGTWESLSFKNTKKMGKTNMPYPVHMIGTFKIMTGNVELELQQPCI